MHLTFASVGGGIALALLFFIDYQVFLVDSKAIWSWSLIDPILHTAIWLVFFWRLYWMYVNTMGYLLPFDNLFLWGADMFAFLGGALASLGIGNNGLWFWFLPIALTVPLIRIKITYGVVSNNRARYGESGQWLTVHWRPWIKLYLILYSLLWIFAVMLRFIGDSTLVANLTWYTLFSTLTLVLSFALSVIVREPLFPMARSSNAEDHQKEKKPIR